MSQFGKLIRELREKNKLPLRKVAAELDIDQAILSKIERGLRKPSKDQVRMLAKLFDYEEKRMMVIYLSDRIIDVIYEEKNYAIDAIRVAEENVEYLLAPQLDRKNIINKVSNYIKSDKNIKKAWVFGSFARSEETINSDLDILIEFDKTKAISFFDMEEIKFNLENLTNRKIDVVEKGHMKPFAWENAKDDLQLIYERQ